MLQRPRSLVKPACCDRGVAMVEFALFLPFLLLLFMGAMASFDGIRAGRQVRATADIVADLISRRTDMDDSTRDRMFEAAETLLGRFTSDGAVSMSMASIVNDDGDLSVLWSEANANASPLIDEDISSLPLPTIPDGESVVIFSLATQYVPFLAERVFDQFTFDNTVFIRPRFIPVISYEERSTTDD